MALAIGGVPNAQSRYSTLGPLGRTVLPSYVGRPLPTVTALAGYFDDSHGYGISVIAGYIGHVEMWDEVFTPAWRRIIDDAPHKISEFKASDCRQGVEEFSEKKGWTKGERDDLTKALVGVIADTLPHDHVVGIGNAVSLPPYAPHPDLQPELKEIGFMFSLQLTILSSLTIAPFMLETDDDEMQMVFDDQPKLKAKIVTHYETAHSILPPEIQSRVNFPEFRDSKKVIPIQAADLLAYETYKEVKNRMERRKPSIALERLFAAKYHYAECVDTRLLIRHQMRIAAGESAAAIDPPHILFNGENPPLRAPGNWLCQ